MTDTRRDMMTQRRCRQCGWRTAASGICTVCAKRINAELTRVQQMRKARRVENAIANS